MSWEDIGESAKGWLYEPEEVRRGGGEQVES